MHKHSRSLFPCAALALAAYAAGAGAAEPAKAAGDAARSSVFIEDEAAPAARQPLVPMSRATREAAREALRQRVTRMHRPDGSAVYRYNGTVLETLVLTRGDDGTMRLTCGDATHTHGAAPAREASDVR